MRLHFILLGAATWLLTSLAAAAGLQVAPVTLTLKAAQNADGITLSNTGEAALTAQVRVYKWTQDGGQDNLVLSRELIASPPMVLLRPDAQQLVRVIRAGPPPAGASEEAFRIVIDELPIAAADRKGLQYVMRYSLPIFVSPNGDAPAPEKLQWTLSQESGKSFIEVDNNGATHAQLADITFTDANGRKVDVHPGLLGYVLPGHRMRWALKTPSSALAAGGAWNAMVNGIAAPQTVQTLDQPR